MPKGYVPEHLLRCRKFTRAEMLKPSPEKWITGKVGVILCRKPKDINPKPH